MSANNSLDADEARLRLEALRSILQATQATSSEIAKWLYASVFAVNSGGLFALTNVEGNFECAHSWAFLSFLIGVFFAFLLGYLTMIRGGMLAESLERQINVQIARSVGNEPSSADDREAQKVGDALTVTDCLPHIVGWLSVASFLIGSVMFGVAEL